MGVYLKPIDEDNFLDVFNLKLREGQDNYVSHPIRSLAQAYVYRTQCQPFGIYADERVVGYVMVIYDYDIPEYDIWHMMIDSSQQGKGYGRAALALVLDYIGQKPFGDSNRVALTCNRDNATALALYRSMGFELTGNTDGDEVELAFMLQEASDFFLSLRQSFSIGHRPMLFLYPFRELSAYREQEKAPHTPKIR